VAGAPVDELPKEREGAPLFFPHCSGPFYTFFPSFFLSALMEDSKLETLLHLVGSYIAEYEKTNIPEPISSPIEALEYLMEEHGLTRKDLYEIGSRGVLSEIFNGKRKLNKRQIIALSKKFKCNPSTFI
jgi:HTH-type transcriptional regulator/antitoxin HigA